MTGRVAQAAGVALLLAACSGGGDRAIAPTSTAPSVTPETPVQELIRLPVEVEPADELREGDTVVVRGTGFDAFTFVRQCVTPPPQTRITEDYCDGSTESVALVDGTGAAEGPFEVRATIDTAEFGEVDCRPGRERCSIALVDAFDPEVLGWAPIDFVESVLPPPDARITVDPVAGLVDGQMVTVTGLHFEKNENVGVSLCPVGDGLCWTVSPELTADADGGFTVEVPVWRLLDNGPGQFVDCAAAAGTCVLSAASYSGSAAEPVPLTFDAAGPMPIIPQTTATPADDLVDGQEVTVSGTGFLPGHGLLLQLCAIADDGTAERCLIDDNTGFDFIDVADDGTWTATLTVVRVVEFDVPVDCGERPGRCGVVAEPTSFASSVIQHAPITPAPALLTFA
jgi:hypothetical protein